MGRGLLDRGGEPGQQGEAGLGEPYGHVEAEAGRGHARGPAHESGRSRGVGSGSGLDGMAGSCDDVRVGRVRAEHRVDSTLVQPMAPWQRDLGVHRLAEQVVLERIATRPGLPGLDEEAAAHGLLERLDDVLLGFLEHLAQARQLHLASEDRRSGQGSDGGFGELPEPVSQHPA